MKGIIHHDYEDARVNLSEYEIEASKEFAEAIVANKVRNAFYKNTRNVSARFFEQLRDGKLAEFGAARYLRRLGYECSDPDLSIGTSRERMRIGFDADLVADGYSIAVKSYTESERFPESYTFQITDPTIHKEDYWLVCGVVDFCAGEFWVRGIIPMPIVANNLRDPIIPRLRNQKRVLYAEDLSPGIIAA